MVFKLFSILLVFLLTQLNAQTFWAQDEESYYADELQEYLMELEESPLNLNKATPEELYKLPWFSREEVKKIVQIRENKDIESWNALRKIGMDEFEIEELKKYITFEDVKKYKFSHRTRIELKENNLDKKSCAKFYQRTQVSTQDFRFGFLIQKDPQESDIFDFYSYYLEFFKNNTHAVIGKYRLNWGQGLIFASKLGFSKTAQTSYTKLYHTNFIAPYTSSYEIWDLQGVASEINLDKFKITTFVSYSPLSASIYDDKIVSFNTTGIHLDPENKNNVKEKLFGMAANYYNDGIEFGIAAFYDEFDKKFADPTLNSKYNMISASVLYDKYHFPVFAEIASAKKKVAAVGGIRFGHDNFKNLLVARYYPKNFPTWHGNPFSNQSNFDNEQGLYYGLKLLPAPKLKLNFYFDMWQHPETQYWEKMPTSGNEQFAMMQYAHKNNLWKLSFKNSNKEKYKKVDEISEIRQVRTTSSSLLWRQSIGEGFTIDSHGKIVSEYLPNEKEFERSFLFYQQFRYQNPRLDIIARLSTHYGNAVIYIYENNVDGIMQNRVCSGEGIYSFLVLKGRLTSNIELQIKYFDYWEKKESSELYFQLVTRF